MPSAETDRSTSAFWTPKRILQAAVGIFTALGAGILIWLIDKAIHFPDIQARQFNRFGDAVPLWIPLILFVLISMTGIVYLFWRASKRVENGEDLYAQRHRRRPGDAE